MPKEKFILVSLKEEESKKLAQIITNDTSRKILDFLADKEATETELAEKLNIPISTVHYNLQALVQGKLVEADEYHYSEKGKEVLHYKLANKYIIIAPQSTYGIKERLRKLLPMSLLVVAASFIVYIYNFFQSSFGKVAMASGVLQEKAVSRIAEDVDMAVENAPMLAQAAALPEAVSQPSIIWLHFIQNPALWFLVGCVFTLLLMITIEYINYKKCR